MTFIESKLTQPAPHKPISDAIYGVAADWVEKTRNQTLSNDETQSLEVWLVQDPRHYTAFRAMENAHDDFVGMANKEDYAHLLGGPTFREKIVSFFSGSNFSAPSHCKFSLTLKAVAVAFFVSWIVYEPSVPSNNVPTFDTERNVAKSETQTSYSTGIGEIREINLEDHSVVTLSADSKIEVIFSEVSRQVELSRGQAFFSVTKDSNRPFLVNAGQASVHVVGTKFDVRRGPSDINIAVLEGVVVVFQENAPPNSLQGAGKSGHVTDKFTKRLVAGQQITTGPGHELRYANEKTITSENVGAWRKGRFSYYGTPLLDVISDANRYYDGEIVLATEDIGALEVSTSYTASQVDQMLNSISLALALEIERLPGGKIILKKTD